jgi:ankyrin repeat protein
MAIKKNADLDEIRNLCLNGLVNIGTDDNFTPLMKASGKDGSLEIVKILVEFGADIEAHSNNDTTALSMAVLHGKKAITEFLISHGGVIDFVVRRY